MINWKKKTTLIGTFIQDPYLWFWFFKKALLFLIFLFLLPAFQPLTNSVFRERRPEETKPFPASKSQPASVHLHCSNYPFLFGNMPNSLLSFSSLEGFFPTWCQRSSPMTNTDILSKLELLFFLARETWVGGIREKQERYEMSIQSSIGDLGVFHWS